MLTPLRLKYYYCHGNSLTKMAVIFDRRLHSPSNQGHRSPHLLEWHSSQPLLAVASKDEAKDSDGAVHIHTEHVSIRLLAGGDSRPEACA